MAEPRKSFLLRISPELWNELEGWSQEEFRSVNGQIEFLLQQAVRERRKGKAAASVKPLETKPEDGKDESTS
jgi:hypothetical protein